MPGGLNEALAFCSTDTPLDGEDLLPYNEHLSTRRLHAMAIDLSVTSKGQVTLPMEVLRHLGTQPGDKLNVELLGERRVQLRPTAGQTVSKVSGCLSSPIAID